MNDRIPASLMGHVRIYREDTGEVVYQEHNVICDVIKSLFSRLMKDSEEPMYGVWGLAVGAGDPAWAVDSQPAAKADQWALFSPMLRKPLSTSRFVVSDGQGGWVPSDYQDAIEFQTVLNATLDNLTVPIREMGLIGGGHHGTTPTDMTHAAFWNPDTRNPDSVTLLNYRTMAPLALPAGVNFIVSWVLQF